MCSEAQSSRLTDCRSAAKLRREDSLMSLLAFVCLSTSRTLVNPANLYFYLFRVNISLILKVFIIQHYLIKMYPYLFLYVIRVGLNNAATSRILVNPAVIIIFIKTVNLNFY